MSLAVLAGSASAGPATAGLALSGAALDATVAALPPGGRVARAWAVLGTVLDPEVPALSVRDLGIVREVIAPDDAPGSVLEIVLTPTYSGCPATEVIEQDCLLAINTAGLGPAKVSLRRAPAWTTDWISASGKAKLSAYGIAPPGPVDLSVGVPIRILRRGVDRHEPVIACPRCASLQTERLSAFGATACKSLYRCLACREPFEYFKPI